MHRSMMSMQGLPIVSEQGVRLGAVQDAYFDASEQRLIALLADWENDLVRGPENLLPITQITELNAEVLTVPDELGETAGLEYEFQVELDGLVLVIENMLDRDVRLKSGQVLGRLVDLQFDPQDGSVAAYEIAKIGDTLEGQTYMLMPRPSFEFADGLLTIPDEAQHDLKLRQPKVGERTPEVTGVAFMEDTGEDMVGEDDIEVSRSASQTQQPY